MIIHRYNTTPECPRVVLCGIGQYGGIVAKILLDIGYEIVGAYNRAGPKIGKDLGEVIGLDQKIGVLIEDIATADLTRTGADVGICTQSNSLRVDMLSYTRLMEASINVISLSMQAYYPFGSDREAAEEIDICARRNKVTFTGSGIHDMTRIWSGIIAAGQCTHLDSLYHESLTNAEEQGLPEQMYPDYAIGATVEEYWGKGFDKYPLWPVYTATLEHVLTALGHTVVEKDVRIEPVVWETDLDCPWLNTVIPAGRVLGTRTIGHVKTSTGITAEVRTEGRVCSKEEEDYTLWRVNGKPGAEMIIKRKNPDYVNAACLVNRIKDVIGAPSGIVPVSLYGPIMGPEQVQHWRHR
jgi:secondary-alkyl amine dehydrogenase [NAD(P)+]